MTWTQEFSLARSLDRQLLEQVRLKSPKFDIPDLDFVKAGDMVVLNVAEALSAGQKDVLERKFRTFELLLAQEQATFQQYLSARRMWETQTHQDRVQYLQMVRDAHVRTTDEFMRCKCQSFLAANADEAIA